MSAKFLQNPLVFPIKIPVEILDGKVADFAY